MSVEDKTEFINTQAQEDAKIAVAQAEILFWESYYKNNPPILKSHPFRDTLLTVSAIFLFFSMLSYKSPSHPEINSTSSFTSPQATRLPLPPSATAKAVTTEVVKKYLGTIK